MSIVNKIFTCLCCSHVSCCAAECIDMWASAEACGLAYLNCGKCCWGVCAPICHSCSLGDFKDNSTHCITGLKYCLYSCALSCVSPFDGCYNCIMYDVNIFKSGVSGFGDIMANTQWLNKIVKQQFGLSNGSEPVATFDTYKP